MKVKLISFIIFCLFTSFFLLQSITASPKVLNSNECNSCHGSGDPAHVLYTVNLGISQTILNGSPTILTATIVNNGYQLSSSSLTLQQSSDYTFKPLTQSDSLAKSLGTVSKGASSIASWQIIPSVNTNRTIVVQVSFQGTAINHKTFMYSNTYSKSVFVSTEKIALLQVSSNPLADSKFLAGTTLSNTSLTISNTGAIEMDNVLVNTTGNILVNSQSSFLIPKIAISSSLSFPIELNSSIPGSNSISVTYLNSTPLQAVTITITIQPVPPVSVMLILGSLLGYVTYILLFLSVVAGAGVYHLKKYISGRKIRIIHSDLANLSFTMAVIHGVILSLPASPWFGTYSWFQLVPQVFLIPGTLSDLGLELGRWTLVLLYIGVISGYYIAKIIKRFGRKVGISIHMLTYLGLILGFIHALLIGSWAKSIIIIPIIMFISIISIGWLKYDAKIQLQRKKSERAKRLNQEKKKPFKSFKQASQPGTFSSGINNSFNHLTCPRCSTLNDTDAFFCKKCGIELWRKK